LYNTFTNTIIFEQCIFIFFLLSASIDSTVGVTKSYVVYLGGHHHDNVDYQQIVDSHHELLGSVLGSKEAAKESIFYSYTTIVNGFAATLEEEHALSLSNSLGYYLYFLTKQEVCKQLVHGDFLAWKLEPENLRMYMFLRDRYGERGNSDRMLLLLTWIQGYGRKLQVLMTQI